MIKQLKFDDVFDGSFSYVPRAIVSLPLAQIQEKFHFRVEEGEDGLDIFLAIPLALKSNGKTLAKFALWRHRLNKQGTFAIHFQLQQHDFGTMIDRIASELDIPEQAIIWRDSGAATFGLSHSG